MFLTYIYTLLVFLVKNKRSRLYTCTVFPPVFPDETNEIKTFLNQINAAIYFLQINVAKLVGTASQILRKMVYTLSVVLAANITETN